MGSLLFFGFALVRDANKLDLPALGIPTYTISAIILIATKHKIPDLWFPMFFFLELC